MRRFGVELYDRWTALWNGDTGLAGEIMAPEFRLRYAQAGTETFDDVRRPGELADVIAGWHRRRPGLRFVAEGPAVVDTEGDDGTAPHGVVARPYRASFTGDDGQLVSRSGTDILRFSGGRITEVWSVSSGAGGRTFY
ncbi:nuclear transport factor 2 family protein [Streptomyces sp. NPDC053079]|uniref:nuclear transport factor 2 family protein n=1 Tax=Streptomyces sp. NPDC053079 TaxID=3365697 RepID=UPI0037CFC782